MAARRRLLSTIVGALVLGVLAACGASSGPAALPPEKKGPPFLYVALGGDDNGTGRTTLASAWPQIFFRSDLPRTAQFVNLARPRSGITQILNDEVDHATRLQPDLVTITLIDDAERATPTTTVEHDLAAVLQRLARHHRTTILVGTVPPNVGTSTATEALNQTITRVADAASVTLVDLPVDNSTSASGAAKIAEIFARAYRQTRRS